MEDITERKGSNVRCYKNGALRLDVFGKDTTYCKMNMKYFPFDKHTCEIQFTHKVRSGINSTNCNADSYCHFERVGIVFNQGTVSNHFVIENGEWELLELTVDTESQNISFKNFIITNPGFTAKFKLQRKPNFYVLILMVPSILVSLISVVGFLLPSESGEKVSLQLTSLLSYTLLFLVVVDIIPPVGGNFPLMGKYSILWSFK